MEQSRWIKFLILLDEPDRVYFQDSSRYLFHYEFARERFARFAGLSVEEFNRRSLYQATREVVLGAVIFPPDPLVPEIGLQFVGYDPFPPEQITQWFRLVQSRIAAAPQVKFFYLPVFEQDEATQAEADFLAAQGIAVSSAHRWAVTDQCYSRGWTLGRLVHLAPQEIAAAYADGRLRAADILLTDAVPTEVPPVAGILTLAPGDAQLACCDPRAILRHPLWLRGGVGGATAVPQMGWPGDSADGLSDGMGRRGERGEC